MPLVGYIYIKPAGIAKGCVCMYGSPATMAYIYTYEGCCREPLSELAFGATARVASRGSADLAGCLLCS